MRLGQEVLTKIQNLLTRMEQKQPRPPRIRKQPKEPYGEPFTKLHEDYKKKLQKLHQKQAEKENIQLSQLSPFKITNKHTIFLNSQLQHQPPLHERLDQLNRQKQEKLIRLREKYPPPKEKELVENQIEEMEMEERRRNQKKYTLRETEEKTRELQMKENERQERLNMLKVKTIQEHSKDYRCKPYVNRQTNHIWKSFKLKKQLSSSVFERFQQYEMERKTHLQKTQRKVRNEVTPFIPKISQNSRLLASRSSSKSNLHQKMTRSISCKCFQRSNPKRQNTSTAMHSSRKA